MKIAIYSGTVPSTTFIERLIQGLAKQSGVELLIVGLKEKKTSYPPNVKVVAYHTWFDFFQLFVRYVLLLAFTSPSKLRICFQTSKKGLRNRIKEFVKKAPIVYHHPDIFHIQWAKALNDWMFLKEQFGIQLVLSLRGAHINYSAIADQQLMEMYKRNFAKVDAFHAVSKAIAQQASQYSPHPLPYKVIYSGLSLKQLPFALKQRVNSCIRIVSVGRPHWIKGYNIAIDAISTLKLKNPAIQLHYEIIGGSNEELAYQISDLKLSEHVKITSGLPFEQVITKIQSADILLMPSVQEGIANVVLEAMALGTLVISSDCGGMPEVVMHNTNGLLFQNRKVKDLARVLQEVQSMNIDNYQRITRQARLTIEQQHNEHNMVQDMFSLYTSTLSSSNNR